MPILLSDAMPEDSKKKSRPIPSNYFSPVSLYRPLKLFGKTFKVHASTALTLSPDTVLRTALDLSLLQLLRQYKPTPDDHWKDSPLKVIKDLSRAITRTNRLSTTTQDGIHRLFGRFIPNDVLAEALQGKELTSPLPWQSDWEAVLRGLGEPGDDDLYQLVQRLARLDQAAWSAHQLPETDFVTLLEPHIGRPQQSWSKYNSDLKLAVVLLVDTSLQALVWMEWCGAAENWQDRREVPVSRLLPFLAEGKKPLGHWLLRMQQAACCANLAEFSSCMVRKGIKRHGFYLSHDLLKKWSSGQQLMPFKAAEGVLEAVGGAVDSERERGLFAVTRFISFLCDLVIAGTRGEPPLWMVAQDQIRRRYCELYEQAATTRVMQ